MKLTVRILLLGIFLCCCHSKESSNQTSANKTNHGQVILGKKFFDFDAIDYYHNGIEDSKVVKLMGKGWDNPLDSLRYGVIFGMIPADINDTFFISKLHLIDYKKKLVDTSKFEAIDSIFTEKWIGDGEGEGTNCVEVFRNILIFRKNGKIIGIAKICFSCMKESITGTNAYTVNFGQVGDYYKLKNILEKK